MRPFVLTPAAHADLNAIADFIAFDHPDAALRVLDALERAMNMLAENPRAGSARRDLANEELRTWAVYSCLIVYRPRSSPLEALRIVHGARDLLSHFIAPSQRERRRPRPKR